MISRDSPFLFYLAEVLLPVVLPLGSDGEAAAAADPVLRGCQAALKHLPVHNNTLIKKEKKIILIYVLYKEIYEGKGFLTYEEMRKYLVIYEEAVSHI